MIRKILPLTVTGLLCFAAGLFLFYLTIPLDAESETHIANPAQMPAIAPESLKAIPLIDLEGKNHTLGEWKQPVLIINFWAPWCSPCRREIPALIALQKEYEPRLQILGLALDSAENITSFAAEYGMNYPSFIIANQIPMYNAVFGNQSGSLPFTAIIDQARTIRYTHTGEISLSLLRDELAKIL